MDAALTTTRMREALAWLTGNHEKAKAAGTAVYEWFWEAIQGDFNDNRTIGQVAFDTAISMVPLIDQICDVRDLVANCRKIRENAEDSGAWLGLALTLVGLFPTIGSLIKGVLKIFLLFVRRHGLEHLLRAVDGGMTWVITFLRKREVQQYLRTQKIDDVFSYLAKEVRVIQGRISVAELTAAFDRGIEVMHGLLENVVKVPVIGKKAKKAIDTVLAVRKMTDNKLGQTLEPVRKVLDAIAMKLEYECRVVRLAIHNVNNIHFRGGLPKTEAERLMKKKPEPEWLSRGTAKWPSLKPKDAQPEIDAKVKEGWCSLDNDNITSFHKMEADTIKGPARLYRIVSPSSSSMGDCWVTEKEFLAIQNSPDPHVAWRKSLAVWPDWNANGQFVVYEIKAGEALKVWRGPAASQVRDDLPGKYLEGGREQIIFKPASKEEYDTMVTYERRPGGALGKELSETEAEKLPLEAKLTLRKNINSPAIRGPMSTGWGYHVFKEELRYDRIGLPALPGQLINH
jgi:hypothetical protein